MSHTGFLYPHTYKTLDRFGFEHVIKGELEHIGSELIKINVDQNNAKKIDIYVGL